MCAIGILETEGLFYLEPVVILDPIMNTSQNMEPVNGNEVVSPPISVLIATHNSGNHSASFLDIMNKTVLHHKIPYWNENETEGDGNCFYNALIDHFQNNPGVYETL